MRDEFGFRSNVVPGLLQEWAQRISTSRFRNMYWQEIQNLIRAKGTELDMRYQVRNAQGKNIWIRCYGMLKWNEDKSKPLFLSGG